MFGIKEPTARKSKKHFKIGPLCSMPQHCRNRMRNFLREKLWLESLQKHAKLHVYFDLCKLTSKILTIVN